MFTAALFTIAETWRQPKGCIHSGVVHMYDGILSFSKSRSVMSPWATESMEFSRSEYWNG